MKVFLEGNIFSQQKIGGISRAGFELAKELSRRRDIEQIFYRGLYIDEYPFKKEWFSRYYGLKRPYFLKGKIFNLLNNIGLEYFYRLNAGKNVIYHSLYYRIPKNPKGSVVVTCYDMIQELFGGNAKTIQFKKKSLERADLIVTMSASAKKDLCALYPIKPEKVIIAPPGVDGIFFKNHSVTKERGDRPYMLYVGARNYKYKNFNLLLSTFIGKKYFLKFDLVAFGGEKKLLPIQADLIKKYNGGTWLKQEFGSDEKLADAYARATVFIYPSLYEGFGIPPLEAMASGCPVIASNDSAIPESVGESGLLFNPEDPDDLAEKIEKIINDKALAADLVKKGKMRARQFTWKNMADIIYRGYQTLL